MKILKICENYFEMNGILVLKENRLASVKALIQNIIIVLMFGPFLCGAGGTFIYYHRDEFEYCLMTLSAICAGILTTGKYFSLKCNENQLKKLIQRFQETVDEGLFYIDSERLPFLAIFFFKSKSAH